MRHLLISVGCMLVLGACAAPRTVPPQDKTLAGALEVGREAISETRLDQAQSQYRAAWKQAMARDDATALSDAGYDLAVTQLALDKPHDALATIEATRAALYVRNTGGDGGLDLVEGTALHRVGAEREAVSRLMPVINGGDAALAERAALILAQIGDGVGDASLLDTARTSLTHSKPVPAVWQADEAEVHALWLLSKGNDPHAAVREALVAADIRRSALDYRGMDRALALGARAWAQGGDMKRAAALWLRAAQSAQSRGDIVNARAWFARAGAVEGAGMLNGTQGQGP